MEFEAEMICSLSLISAEKQEGSIPCAVEYRTAHGSGFLPLHAVLDEAFRGENGIVALKLLQGGDGVWKAVLHTAGGERSEWELSAQTGDSILSAAGIANPIHAPEFDTSAPQDADVPWNEE